MAPTLIEIAANATRVAFDEISDRIVPTLAPRSLWGANTRTTQARSCTLNAQRMLSCGSMCIVEESYDVWWRLIQVGGGRALQSRKRGVKRKTAVSETMMYDAFDPGSVRYCSKTIWNDVFFFFSALLNDKWPTARFGIAFILRAAITTIFVPTKHVHIISIK